MAKLQTGTRIYGTASTDGKLTANSITIPGGTTSIAPLTFTSGSSLTTQTAGAMEYDGTNMYVTPESTSGRGAVGAYQQFVLSADVTAFGATIGNYFGATSAVNLLASSYYDIECFCYFLKTTAGTLTWAPTVSSAATLFHGYYESTPDTGFTTTTITAGLLVFEATQQTATTAAFSISGSKTTAVYHLAKFKIKLLTNAACNFRLNVTQSAGTITPKAGSYYTVRRLVTNAGNFVA